MADAVELREATVARRNLNQRWLALGSAARDWSREHPHEYALLYGSPVPGYAAPMDTVEQATRPLALAVAILADGVERGVLDAPTDRLAKPVRADVQRAQDYPGFDRVPPTLLARLMTTWAQLFGTISFELFGRYQNVVENLDDYFEHELRGMSRYLGLSK